MYLSKRNQIGLSALIVIIAVLGMRTLMISAKADNNQTQRIVSNVDQLKQTLNDAKAGDVIVVKDGEYTASQPISLQNKNGTEQKPIIIKAQNQGKAILAGNLWLSLTDCSYVTIEGLNFKEEGRAGNWAVKLTNCSNVRITRNHLHLQEQEGSKDRVFWISINGDHGGHNRVDHNLLENKFQPGHFIAVSVFSQYNRIDHNDFRHSTPQEHNGKESIYIGGSTVSKQSAFATVEDNLFEQCDGEQTEIITVKCCDNIIRGNTFFESQGGLCFRHGDRNIADGNYFLGNNKPLTGGIRIYGDDHKVINNYFMNLTGTGFRSAIVLGSGNVDITGDLGMNWRVNRALIANNTLVNNQEGLAVSLIAIAKLGGAYPPKDTTIANNIIYAQGAGKKLIDRIQESDIHWENNIIDATDGAEVGFTPNEGVRIIDPLLVLRKGLYVLGEGSPAIDAAVPFKEITHDINGSPRGEKPSIGAYEYQPGKPLHGPLTPDQVGINAP